MGLIVQKFGGTSVANAERLRNVAEIIAETYRQGNQVVAVLSAQGDTTTTSLKRPRRLTPRPPGGRWICSCPPGSRSLVLCVPWPWRPWACQWFPSQAGRLGCRPTASYSSARIKKIDVERIQSEIDRNHSIVIVTGFQGINKYGDITTLGRGGSDTSAVALAAALKADLCQIYTDVDGIYTADPRHVKGARKLEEITFDEMLELASLGAQVLHNRSVELAKKYQVNLEVLSSFERKPGTKVKEVAKNMEKTQISGVATDKNVARLALVGVEDRPGIAYKVFSLLGQKNINVDIIVQSIGRQGTQDISFTVRRSDVDQAVALLQEHKESLPFDHIDVDQSVVKVSIVGAGMVDNAGVAAKMFGALYDADINIHMISTSEIKVSVLLDESDAKLAVQAIHDKFFGE